MRSKILVTGAGGQIGTELTAALRAKYGVANVIASDLGKSPTGHSVKSGLSESFDVCDLKKFLEIVGDHEITMIYHLAGILSAVGEADPERAWNVNIGGLHNGLEAAKIHGCSLFFPSSIGAFGPEAPSVKTPQVTIQRPTTIYGITKLTGELLCDYYHHHFGVDTRGLRYPGIVSYQAPPGGGTTDYAVDIFHGAIEHGSYTCFLKKNTFLDMMYMPDAIRAAMELMEAPSEKLIHRNAFNITAMSFSPEQIGAEIKVHLPEFTMDYQIDPVRQAIADSWPDSLDDSAARTEWGWLPEYDLTRMTRDMIAHLKKYTPRESHDTDQIRQSP